MTYIVEVVPYNSKWPEIFQKEALLIQQALGSNCITIHHIGSTSVPRLPAKPVIDILPVVKDILEVDAATEAMSQFGYDAKGEYGIVFRRYFQKGEQVRTHNVHVYQEGDPEIDRYLKFRDWLREHDDDAKAYGDLKSELAAQFPNDILKYCEGKDLFVADIDQKDGYDGWRVVRALTSREWTAVNFLRKQYFSQLGVDDSTGIIEDKDHIHFVFYKNADIIGYAHLKLCSEKEAMAQVIAIDPICQNHGFENQLLSICTRWLSHQGRILSNECILKNRMKFEVVKNLRLPIGQYALTGSCALGIRNLREIGDIDIIVAPELWNTLAGIYGVTDEDGIKRIKFPDGIVEAFGEFSFYNAKVDSNAPTLLDRIASAEIIDGLPFEALEHVLYYKRKMGREKDLKDIFLIEECLKG